MYREHTVAVVVPAYNEVAFVGDVLATVPEYVDRVYAVDDCSTDGTWAEIRRHASFDPSTPAEEGARIDSPRSPAARSDGGDRSEEVGAGRSEGPLVVPIRHEENRGVGAAITTGYQQALADDVDVTAVMAGDGQMDPDYLDRLLDPIVDGRVAYAKGNRLRGQKHHETMSTFRFGGNVVLSLLTKIASGYWGMVDPQNGYTAISHEALEAIDLDSLYTEYGFSNDLLVALNSHGFSIADVTMPAVYGDERSHISYRSFVPKLSWLLWRRFLHRLGIRYVLRDFHPLVGLYALGVGGLVVGAGSLFSRLIRRQRSGGSALVGSTQASTLAGDSESPRSAPRTGAGAGRSRLGIAGLWMFCSAIALFLAMVFDHDANEGLVVIDE